MPNDYNWDTIQKDDYAKSALETTNVVGDLWGAVSHGQKDPIQKMFEGGPDYGNVAWGNSPDSEAVFKQMDKAQWDEVSNLRQEDQRKWIWQKAQDLKSGKAKPGVFWNPGTQKSDAAPGSGPKVDPMDQKINDFYAKMMGPLDQNDPEVQRATNNATGIANRQASMQGLAGPMSVYGAVQAGTNAQAGLQQFRQGLAAQALGMQSNRDLGLKNLQEEKYHDAQNNSLAGYQSEQAHNQALWGTVGGVVGGVYGGPAGYAAGSKIGSGMSGQLSGQGPYKPPSDPSYNGGTY